MGIYKVINHSLHSFTGIWKITEREGDLFPGAFLSDKEKSFLLQVKSENRRKEWLATRCLLNGLLRKPCRIYYSDTGKPFIHEPGHFISISHTPGYAAVSINQKEETGLDIQTIGHKVERLKHKFMSEAELAVFQPGLGNPKLTLYWCAKEALYKLYGRKELDFKANLFISPFEVKTEGIMQGSILKENFLKNYLLHYYIYNTFVIVFVGGEIPGNK